jgi:hypothetical protein
MGFEDARLIHTIGGNVLLCSSISCHILSPSP